MRVGRAPIDETAIRLLEQHNPDVQFDWTRILKAPPAAEPGRRDARDSRDRDQRGRREPRAARGRSGGTSSSSPGAQSTPRRNPAPASIPEQGAPDEFAAERAEAAEYAARAEAAELAAERARWAQPAAGYAGAPADHAEQALGAEAAAAATAAVGPVTDPVEQEMMRSGVPDRPPSCETGVEHEEVIQAVEPAQTFEAPEPRAPREPLSARPEDVGSASYQRLGAEGLVRLRARYAEVMARIAERPLEDEAREELKQRAERLNPDAWVTADEVTAALEQYEVVFDGLRGVVGHHPSRRRRGRR